MMSNTRKEFILTVPIKSTSVKEFINIENCKEALKFIQSTLEANYGIEGGFRYVFNEIIKNAFDSYVQAGLKPGNEFILKVVIKEKDKKIIVNVMDNGDGFDRQPKCVYFKRDVVTFRKKSTEHFGHMQVGLLYCEQELAIGNTASLFFKNRKKIGATTSVQFNESYIKKIAFKTT